MPLTDPRAEGVGVVALVGDQAPGKSVRPPQGAGKPRGVHNLSEERRVVLLGGAKKNCQGDAGSVRDEMDLGPESPARPA